MVKFVVAITWHCIHTGEEVAERSFATFVTMGATEQWSFASLTGILDGDGENTYPTYSAALDAMAAWQAAAGRGYFAQLREDEAIEVQITPIGLNLTTGENVPLAVATVAAAAERVAAIKRHPSYMGEDVPMGFAQPGAPAGTMY